MRREKQGIMVIRMFTPCCIIARCDVHASTLFWVRYHGGDQATLIEYSQQHQLGAHLICAIAALIAAIIRIVVVPIALVFVTIGTLNINDDVVGGGA